MKFVKKWWFWDVFKWINGLIRNLFWCCFLKFYIQSTLPPLYSTSEIILVCVQKLIETSYFHQMNKGVTAGYLINTKRNKKRRLWYSKYRIVAFLMPLGTNNSTSININKNHTIEFFHQFILMDNQPRIKVISKRGNPNNIQNVS